MIDLLLLARCFCCAGLLLLMLQPTTATTCVLRNLKICSPNYSHRIANLTSDFNLVSCAYCRRYLAFGGPINALSLARSLDTQSKLARFPVCLLE